MTSPIRNPHEPETHHEHGGPAIYTKNLLALLILTGITVAAAGVNFGSGNIVIALTIATIKVALVALFFMHLRWEKPVNAIIGVAGFLFLGIFLMFCLIDSESRNYYLPTNVHPTTVPLTPGSAPQSLTVVPPSTPPETAGTPSPPPPEKK